MTSVPPTLSTTTTPQLLTRITELVTELTGVALDERSARRLLGLVAQSLAPHAHDPAGGTDREVTVLLTDLRGFTGLSEISSAQTVFDVLNRYLTRMCEIVVANGGSIDKFMGDAIMVLFGAERSHPDDARRAVTCALQMQNAMDEINHDLAASGLPALYMGAGINTGHVMAGTLGSALHSEFTVIGDEVNLASRIESFSLRGQVLVSEATYERCAGFVEASGPMDVHVKGKSQLVRMREVLAVPSLGLHNVHQEVRNGPRVTLRMPFGYQVVQGKIVLPQQHRGLVLDLGYRGIHAEVQEGLSPHANLLLLLDLSLIGKSSGEVYCKVRSVRHHAGAAFAGIEFTSLSEQAERDIQMFVQLLIQGSPTK